MEEVASELDNGQAVFSATRERLFAVGFSCFAMEIEHALKSNWTVNWERRCLQTPEWMRSQRAEGQAVQVTLAQNMTEFMSDRSLNAQHWP